MELWLVLAVFNGLAFSALDFGFQVSTFTAENQNGSSSSSYGSRSGMQSGDTQQQGGSAGTLVVFGALCIVLVTMFIVVPWILIRDVRRNAVCDPGKLAWTDMETGSGFVNRYGILFSKYRRSLFWWKGVHFCVRVVCSALIALPITPLGLEPYRNTVAATVAVVYFGYAAAVVAMRPFMRRAFMVLDALINCILGAIAAASIVITTVPPSSSSPSSPSSLSSSSSASEVFAAWRDDCAGREIAMTVLGVMVVGVVVVRTLYSAGLKVWRFRLARRASKGHIQRVMNSSGSRRVMEMHDIRGSGGDSVDWQSNPAGIPGKNEGGGSIAHEGQPTLIETLNGRSGSAEA